jgi:hypothetical protein
MVAQEYFTVFLDKNVHMVVAAAEIFNMVAQILEVLVEQADQE